MTDLTMVTIAIMLMILSFGFFMCFKQAYFVADVIGETEYYIFIFASVLIGVCGFVLFFSFI